MSTPEYRTMVRCTVSLTNTLAGDIKNMGDLFFQEGLISPGVHEITRSHIKEPAEKARELVGALTSKVKTSRCFHDIVRILMKQGDWINDLIEKLRIEYKENDGKNFPVIGRKSVQSASPPHSGSRENNSYRNGANNRKKTQKTFPQKDREGHSCNSTISDNRGGFLTYCVLPIMTISFITAVIYIGYMVFCVWSTNAICPGNQSAGFLTNKNNARQHSKEGTDICHRIVTQEDKKLVHMSLSIVGDWSDLCLYLDVKDKIRNALKYAAKQVQQKRTECVDAYLEDTVPLCFEKVVKVLCVLNQSNRAKELAEKKDVDFLTVCEPAL